MRTTITLTYDRASLLRLVMEDAGIHTEEILSEEWNADGVTLTLDNEPEADIPE